MPVILLTNKYPDKAMNILVSMVPDGFDLITLKEVSKNNLLKLIEFADYLLVSGRIQVDDEVISKARNLKMVQRTGVGVDMLNIEALEKRKIPVYINPGVNAISVAEHTMTLILATLKNLVKADESVKSNKWEKHKLGLLSSELFGKKVGLVGLGNIGKKLVKMLQAFGAEVLYYKPNRIPESEETVLGVVYHELNDLLPRIDVLCLLCPLNAETEKIIGFNEFAIMKRDSIIINTARGRLIDQDALIHFLENGHFKGVGLDVFGEEPILNDNPLLSMSQTVLTPHIGGITYESFKRMIHEAMSNIMSFYEGDLKAIEEKRYKVEVDKSDKQLY